MNELKEYPRKIFRIRLKTELNVEGVDAQHAVERLFYQNGVSGFLANAFEIENLGEVEDRWTQPK